MLEFGEIQELIATGARVSTRQRLSAGGEVEDYAGRPIRERGQLDFPGKKLSQGAKRSLQRTTRARKAEIDRCSGRGDHNRDPPVAHCIGERIAALEDARPTQAIPVSLQDMFRQLLHLETTFTTERFIRASLAHVQHHVIDVAPAPAFPRLDGSCEDGMLDRVEMLRRKLVLSAIGFR